MKADVYKAQCPSRVVLDIISNKWVILIILKLAEKPYRFGALKREIEGVSAKVLTELLKKLVVHGLVSRIDNSGLVLHVEYSLTNLGKSLSLVCKHISDWAKNNIAMIINEVASNS